MVERLRADIPRVVVTGMGAITPNGNSVDEFWDRSVKGETGIVQVDLPPSDVKVAGQVRDFQPHEVFSNHINAEIAGRRGQWKGVVRRVGTAAQFALVSAYQALLDAEVIGEGYQIDPSVIDPEQIGTIIGTGIGGGEVIGEVQNSINKNEVARRFAILRMLGERVASVPSMVFGAQGPMWSVMNACATGPVAIQSGYDQIILRRATMMIAGVAEHSVHPLGAALFTEKRIRPITREVVAENASRPFDVDRDGFVLGEGAGSFVLEEYEHARKRDAHIYAELVGVGNTADAYHETVPSGIGSERAMKEAFRWAYAHYGLVLEDGEDLYINAHCPGTPVGDPVECEAIKRTVPQAGVIYTNSSKSGIGHTLSAAGIVGSIQTIMAIKERVVPPTIHLENRIPEASGLSVSNEAQSMDVRMGMNNSFGFGGGNAVVIFKRPELPREI